MRGALLMSTLAITAALALHYWQSAQLARESEASRSDPLINLMARYRYPSNAQVPAPEVSDARE